MDGEEDFVAEEENLPEDAEIETPEDDAEDEAAENTDDEGDSGSDTGDNEPPRSRANTRIRSLNSDKKAAVERAEKAEREMSELRRQMEDVQRTLQSGSAVKDAAAEQELLEQMDPVQRVAYNAEKQIHALNAKLQRVEFSSIDSADRADFATKYGSQKEVARLLPEVEKTLAQMRAGGHNAPREQVLSFVIGKDHLERLKTGSKNPNKQDAKARVDSTQGRPTSARSDASSGRGKGKTSEERLAGIEI